MRSADCTPNPGRMSSVTRAVTPAAARPSSSGRSIIDPGEGEPRSACEVIDRHPGHILHGIAVVVADALAELHEPARQLIGVKPVPGRRHRAARPDRPVASTSVPALFEDDVL